MTIAFIIYLVGLIGNLNIAFVVTLCISAAWVILQGVRRVNFADTHSFPYTKEVDALRLQINKSLKDSIIYAAIILSLGTILPKEKTAWLMLGGYISQTVYESEDGQKYRKLIMQKIDEAIGETVQATQGEKP